MPGFRTALAGGVAGGVAPNEVAPAAAEAAASVRHEKTVLDVYPNDKI